MHSWIYDRYRHTPRLAVLSPIRGCGKTSLLSTIRGLAARADRLDDVTPAALIRLTHTKRTVLLDEADTIDFSRHSKFRKIMNSGHADDGASALLLGGVMRSFSTFAPMAIAAIGTLPLTVMDRSLTINMQRGTRPLRRLGDADTDSDLRTVRQLIEEWASAVVLDLDPPIPAELRGRAADNWRPLISIALSFGEEWGEATRNAAIALESGRADEDLGVQLLRDTRDIFNAELVDRISRAALSQACSLSRMPLGRNTPALTIRSSRGSSRKASWHGCSGRSGSGRGPSG
jgi:uncharacterized protein DUF3631